MVGRTGAECVITMFAAMGTVNLQDLPIAITGASSGIGAATALACAEAGMPVVLGARRVERCEALVREITSRGGRAVAVEMDVTVPQDCTRLVDRTIEAFGSIYSVYANAGYGIESGVMETDDQAMRAIFETNFFGTMNTIRPAVEAMKLAGRGHVLICSSCIAKMSIPYYAAYSATKAAQAHLGRAMNLELAPLGIHTTVVCPGPTRTEFSEKVRTEWGSGRMIRHRPEAAADTAEDVARATVKALRRPRAEVWLSWPMRLGMAFCNAFPGVEHFVLRRMVTKREANSERVPAGRVD